jgi:carboxylesterase type B
MQNVSYAMQAHWAAFAATGDPNSHGLKWIPKWPIYDDAEQNFVYNATLDNTLNMHIEVDDFRTQAIGWLNARWPLLNRG